MSIILGLDPGSRVTGWGVVDARVPARVRHLGSGCIKTGSGSLASRLDAVHRGVLAAVAEFQPDQVAVEQVFVHRSAASALKLGQARGAAIAAAAGSGLPVAEYGPRVVKLAITGTGAAAKAQVQHMVTALLQLDSMPAEDAADALALALTHLHATGSPQLLAAGVTPGSSRRRSSGRSRAAWRKVAPP